jgi:hypothetical protein
MFEQAWRDGRLAKRLEILTAPLIFVAGAVLSTFIDGGLKDADASWVVVAWLGGAMILVAIILVSRFHSQELAAGEYRKQAAGVHDEIEKLAQRLEVTVELIPEESGETYDATTKLIKSAKKSLLFVDIWVPTRSYQEPGSTKNEARDAYYAAIVAWLKNRLESGLGGPCYRRIIQLDPDATVETLASDPTTRKHLSDCFRLTSEQPGAAGAAEIQRAKKRFWSNIAIIDRRYVVHTLLVVKDGRPARHAAMIYHDPQGKIVPRYEQLVARLEASAIENLDALLLEGTREG